MDPTIRYVSGEKVLLWADGGGYSVMIPNLPGCYTEGDTLEEALENAKEAIDGHREAGFLLGAYIKYCEEERNK